MTEHQTRLAVGFTLVGSHIIIFSSLIVSWLVGGFQFEEFVTTVGIIAPLFTGYTTAFVRYVNDAPAKFKNVDRTHVVSSSYIALSLLYPAMFSILILLSILAKNYNFGIHDFDEFKKLIMLIEVVVGIYVGVVISGLFHKNASGNDEGNNATL